MQVSDLTGSFRLYRRHILDDLMPTCHSKVRKLARSAPFQLWLQVKSVQDMACKPLQAFLTLAFNCWFLSISAAGNAVQDVSHNMHRPPSLSFQSVS